MIFYFVTGLVKVECDDNYADDGCCGYACHDENGVEVKFYECFRENRFSEKSFRRSNGCNAYGGLGQHKLLYLLHRDLRRHRAHLLKQLVRMTIRFHGGIIKE